MTCSPSPGLWNDAPGAPPSRSTILPARLGPHTLHERLATGGMGEMYLARRSVSAGRRPFPVVIERLRPHLAQDERFVAMLLEEARLVSRIQHPSVARIFELGRSDEGPFIVLELVPGEPLAAVLAACGRGEAELPPVLAAHIASRVASALHHAHELRDGEGRPLRLVHRDVSPANILLSFGGQVKLIDFGIAKGDGPRLVQTQVGVLKGKLAYMSPEQASGAPVDHRSDVFALGVVLWEALTGRRLFRRDSDVEILRAVIEAPHPRVSRYVDVDPELERIVDRALAKEPAERFPSALRMRRALERYIARASTEVDLETDAVGRFMQRSFPARARWWRERIAALRARAPSAPVLPARAATADLEPLSPHEEDETEAITLPRPHPPPPAARWPWRRVALIMAVAAALAAGALWGGVVPGH